MNEATVAPNKIAVTHTVRPDVGREFLSFPISGWDEVKKLVKKVLVYDGREFTFSAWNSDRNDCHFMRLLGDSAPVTAEFKKRK